MIQQGKVAKTKLPSPSNRSICVFHISFNRKHFIKLVWKELLNRSRSKCPWRARLCQAIGTTSTRGLRRAMSPKEVRCRSNRWCRSPLFVSATTISLHQITIKSIPCPSPMYRDFLVTSRRTGVVLNVWIQLQYPLGSKFFFGRTQRLVYPPR